MRKVHQEYFVIKKKTTYNQDSSWEIFRKTNCW